MKKYRSGNIKILLFALLAFSGEGFGDSQDLELYHYRCASSGQCICTCEGAGCWLKEPYLGVDTVYGHTVCSQYNNPWFTNMLSPNQFEVVMNAYGSGSLSLYDFKKFLKKTATYGAINYFVTGIQDIPSNGRTLLMNAAYEGWYEVVVYLLNLEASKDMKDEDDKTALDFARIGRNKNHGNAYSYKKIITLLKQ